MTEFAPDDRTFQYTAVNRAGKEVRDLVRARDLRAATRALAQDGLTPISLQEARAGTTNAPRGRNRDFTFSEKVAVLRQLALMVRAGVGLLEALQTIVQGVIAAKARPKLEAVIMGLKRGESFAAALEAGAPGFPFYVYAMCRVGEATGRLPEVLSQAADQMAFEDKLRKDVLGSLTYPAILLTVGLGVVSFLLVQVLPSFKTMINKDVPLPFPSNMMFGLSHLVTSNPMPLLITLGGLVAAAVAAASNRRMQQSLYVAARGLPLIGTILRAREITSWARLLGFALTSGVNLLEAAALARSGSNDGPFRHGLEQFERDLKAGVDVAESLSRHTPLSAMDLSLLRAGQKSGTLPTMFTYIADDYDGTLRSRLKQLVAFVEPLTIGLIAVMVALVAVSIALAMLTTYQNIDT